MPGEGIGYNISQAKNLIGQVKQGYTNMYNTMTNNWGGVSSAFTTKWVSINSEKYEKALAKHIAETHLAATQTIDALIHLYINATNKWITDECGTDLTSGGETMESDFDLKSYLLEETSTDYRIDAVSENDTLKGTVKAAKRDFSEGTDMKIEDAATAQTLFTEIETYVNDVKTAVSSSYDALDTSSAFHGDVQQTSIDNLTQSVNAKVQELTTFLGDLQTVLEEMVGIHIKADQEIGAAATEAANAVSETIFE